MGMQVQLHAAALQNLLWSCHALSGHVSRTKKLYIKVTIRMINISGEQFKKKIHFLYVSECMVEI